MMWRIFRKDWGQLWPLMAIVTIAQFTNAALWFALGRFQEPRGLVTLAQLFALATSLGIVALVATVVQQDVLPGVSQDWLIRPIRRSDLLRAKLVFVMVAVHGPMLLADAAHGTAAGLAFRDSLAAALARSLSMLLIFELPVFALAAVTRTLVQVAASVLGIWLVVVAGVAIGIVARGGAPPAFAGSGIQWMTPTFWSLLALSTAAVVIPVQYLRRATGQARRLIAGAVLLAPVLSLSTWGAAFSVQRALSPTPAAARPIAIAFDPGLGRSPSGLIPTSTAAVLLPLRVSGLAADSIVMNDRADVRLVGHDGATLFRGRTTATLGYGDDFPVRTTEGGDVRTHQRVVLPDKVYEHVRAMPVRVEIDYSLTLFRIQEVNTLPAANGDGRFSAFGRCATKMDEEGDDIEVGCANVGAAPTCVFVTLEDPTSGARNPENHLCDPDYAPYRMHVYPDVMSHLSSGLRFRDPQGLTRYPVDGSRVGAARVRLTSYRPVAHFARRLVIPEVRLGEWSANAADNETRPH
jgi:hypothetical protein